MENILRFIDPAEETENLKDLARAEYLEASQAVFTQTGQYPAVEDLFPDLCDFINRSGQAPWEPITFPNRQEEFQASQLDKLLSMVETSFRLAPSAVHSLIALPPFPLTAPPVLAQPQAVEAKPPAQDVPNPSTTAPSPIRPVPARGSGLTRPPRPEPAQIAAVKEPGKDVAYEVAQTLLQVESIKMLGEAIYQYTGTFYRYITAEDMRRLIMQRSRDAVAREGNARLVDAVFKVIVCEPDICPPNSDIAPNLVSLQNGVLNLETGQFYLHDPRFNTFYMVNGNYVPSRIHPVFDRVLETITGGDPTLAQRIIEVIGYCLSPDTRGKVFFVFQGVPDSGKSLLASFIRECLNVEATAAPDLLSLGDRFSASALIGKQLCLTMDMPSAPLGAKTVSTFKTLTGGDLLTADIKYRPAVTFRNTAKFILGTNHPLLTQYPDPAFFRRAIVVPFAHSIPRGQMDVNLLPKLLAERDAIIRHALDSYRVLRSRNYVFSGNYQVNAVFGDVATPYVNTPSTEDFLSEFVHSACETGAGCEAFTDDLYRAFAAKFGMSPVPNNQFSARLLEVCQQLGLAVRRGSGTGKKRRPGGGSPVAYLTGIALKESASARDSQGE